jgi:hypothetical protein
LIKEAEENQNKSKEKLSQTLLSDFVQIPLVMQLCVDLAVDCGRPYTIFNDPPMKKMILASKSFYKDSSKQVINPENVKQAVNVQAKCLKEKIVKSLKGKILHFTADMASRHGRSFLGEFKNVFFLAVSTIKLK